MSDQYQPKNCTFFGSMRGCSKGALCKDSHSDPNSIPFCPNYQYPNHCKNGNNCQYRHTSFPHFINTQTSHSAQKKYISPTSNSLGKYHKIQHQTTIPTPTKPAANIVNDTKEDSNTPALDDLPKLGDKVKTMDGSIGTVKFVGLTHFAEGIWIGLELLEWSYNALDGVIKGVRYFTCERGHGLFVQLSDLIENFGPNYQESETSDLPDIDNTSYLIYGFCRRIYEAFPANIAYYTIQIPIINICISFHGELINLQIGDRIKLSDGKTGHIRNIKQSLFAGQELYGIELDTFTLNVSRHHKLSDFHNKSSPEKCHFARRAGIIANITFLMKENAFARLQGLRRVPKFNGQMVQLVAFVEKKGRWKVKLRGTGNEKKYLGVRAENLDPVIDCKYVNEGKDGLRMLPKIGDRVRTREGKYGIVRYVGSVEFGNSAGRVNDCIGLELENWDPNGHRGVVVASRFYSQAYFKANDGHGYFVRLNDLIENIDDQSVYGVK